MSPAVAMESAGFMNALTSAASAAPVVRKRKRVSTAAKVHAVWLNYKCIHFNLLFCVCL